MVFQPHVVDVARHAELRFRRVFPVSWEAGLKESYQQALEKYQKQIELEKELWQAMQEASALRNRVDILGWFKLNLSELQKAVASGNLSEASEFIARLREEIERRELEERELLTQKETQLGGKVSYSTGKTGYVYIPPPTTQTQQQAQPQKEPQTIAYVSTQTGKVYTYDKTTGVLRDTSSGMGYSTATPTKLIQQLESPPKPTQPTSLFGGAQSFYNPFR